jgi:hypothetical protein
LMIVAAGLAADCLADGTIKLYSNRRDNLKILDRY